MTAADLVWGVLTPGPPELISATKAADFLLSGEYVFNQASKRVSHVVPSVDGFDDYGDVATVCGVVASSADLLPNFQWCAECVKEET